MQPGLNLKIPDLTSNPHLALLSQKTKSPSPKPKVHKPLKSLTHPAPYLRITSKKSLKQLSIPSFLQTSLRIDHKPTSSIPHASLDQTTNISSSKCEKPEKKHSPKKNLAPKTQKEVFDLVLTDSIKDSQYLLQVGKVRIKKFELKSLHPEVCIDRKVIDACLRCFKHINRKMFKLNEDIDRVFIVDTESAQELFTGRCKESISAKNPLKYNKVLFPLFLGYWTMVVLDNRLIKVSLYNVDRETEGEVFESIKFFIDQELKFHDKKFIQCSSWGNLQLESLKTQVLTDAQSSAYTLKLAYKLSVNPETDLNPRTLSNFRNKLLILLFNHGVLII